MNPLAAVLAGLALAGPLVARGRPAGRAWLVVGLAATALLWPALAIPGGIPSPAASLGEHPPWQAELAARRGNPALSDVTYQIAPWLLFVRHEMRAGRLPFWNPFQYAGAPLLANGQSAPLFPLHLLFVALPQPLAWLLLPWLKVAIGGMGAWFLGRRFGLSEPAALLAAVAFPLAGMPASYLLYPLGSAVALAPWVLAAVERLAAERRGTAPLAAVAGLQLLSGHPEICLQTAMLAALYLLVRGAAPGVRPAAAWGRLLAGWTTGAGLAAVHLLPLAVHLLGSSRWQREDAAGVADLGVRLVQPLRLVLPQLYGDPAQGTWWGPFYYPSTAVYAGAVTLVLAVAGLAAAGRRRTDEPGTAAVGTTAAGATGGGQAVAAAAAAGVAIPSAPAGAEPAAGGGTVAAGATAAGRPAAAAAAEPGPAAAGGVPPGRRDRRWLAVVALLAFSFATAYYWFGLHHLLGLLPVVGRVLHHRLLFGVDLGLALLAGAGLDRWRRGAGRRGIFAGTVLVLGSLNVAWLLYGGEWSWRRMAAEQTSWTLWLAAAAVLVAALRLVPVRRRAALAWLLPAIVAADLVAAHDSIHPGLPLDRLYPRTGALDVLAGRPGRVIAPGAVLRPNAATVYRLSDVRGDDTLKPVRWDRFAERRLGASHPTYFTPVERWEPATLDRLAVRWVLTGPGEPPPVPGMRLAYRGRDARVWERAGAPGFLRWLPGEAPCTAQVVTRRPGAWTIDWRCAGAATLVVAESWDRGWRAEGAGAGERQRLEVELVEEIFLGVALPAGEGRLELEYRPAGWEAGVVVSGVVGVWLGLVGVAGWRRRWGRGRGWW